MVIYVEEESGPAQPWLNPPIGVYDFDNECGAQENLHSDHWCICTRQFGHGHGHHCDHCGLWWLPGDSVKIAEETPGSLNKRRLLALDQRKREQPWFRDEHLVELVRRADLFVDADEVAAHMQVAMASGRTIALDWMTLEEDDFGADQPVQRSYRGIAVMDIIDAYPLGWAYLAHPNFTTVLAVSLDVITNVRIEL